MDNKKLREVIYHSLDLQFKRLKEVNGKILQLIPKEEGDEE